MLNLVFPAKIVAVSRQRQVVCKASQGGVDRRTLFRGLVAGGLTALIPAYEATAETLSEPTLAYTFSYPTSTQSGRNIPVIFSRRPEKYSSAAPLSAGMFSSESFLYFPCHRIWRTIDIASIQSGLGSPLIPSPHSLFLLGVVTPSFHFPDLLTSVASNLWLSYSDGSSH